MRKIWTRGPRLDFWREEFIDIADTAVGVTKTTSNDPNQASIPKIQKGDPIMAERVSMTIGGLVFLAWVIGAWMSYRHVTRRSS